MLNILHLIRGMWRPWPDPAELDDHILSDIGLNHMELDLLTAACGSAEIHDAEIRALHGES